jgi:hypothetical protein
MTPLSHSAAHEQLADLALEPAALQRLAREVDGVLGSAPADPLAAHVATCAACRAEIANWQRVHGTVAEALAGPDGPQPLEDLALEDRVAAPASLRMAVQGIPAGDRRAAEGVATGAAGSIAAIPSSPRGRGLRPTAWMLPLVAVLAVVVVAGGLLLDQAGRLNRANAEAAALAAVTVTLDRVIRDPEHRIVELRTPGGTAGGSVVWSSHDLVVLTSTLAAPPGNAVYRCWVELDGKRSPVGRMFFAEGTGYWTGSLDDWATISLGAASTFGISLEPASGSTGSPAVLAAQLGG